MKNYILQTERLALRELTMDDERSLSLVLSDAESMKYYPHPFSKTEVQNWIQWNILNYREYGFGLWAVELRKTGEFLGDCGITMQNIEGVEYPEIGYHIRKEYRRQGFAAEAVQACIKYAFGILGKACVVSYMKSDNIPSRGVAEKCGMHFVKSFKKEVFGKLVDDEVMYMTKA